MSTAALPTGTVEGPDTVLRDELRTTGMVWLRELIRFERTRTRILSGLVQPILFLFVIGYGMSGLVGSAGGFDFKKFVFPGILAMSVVTTAIFSGMSIVWDREFGFLREMLVAPVSRASLVLGKTAGGASVAAVQGTIMLVLAPLIGVHLTAVLVSGDHRLRAADGGRADRLRRVRRQPHRKDGELSGRHADGAVPDDLPLGRDVPAERAAGLADGPYPNQPAHLCGRSAAPGGVRGAEHAGGRPRSVSPHRGSSSATRSRSAPRSRSWWSSPAYSSHWPSAGSHGPNEQ